MKELSIQQKAIRCELQRREEILYNIYILEDRIVEYIGILEKAERINDTPIKDYLFYENPNVYLDTVRNLLQKDRKEIRKLVLEYIRSTTEDSLYLTNILNILDPYNGQ